MINMIELWFGLSRVIGILMTSYGAMLALIPESGLFNTVGLISYYVGAYQMCIADPINDREEFDV
jgi:hypothetical protein